MISNKVSNPVGLYDDIDDEIIDTSSSSKSEFSRFEELEKDDSPSKQHTSSSSSSNSSAITSPFSKLTKHSPGRARSFDHFCSKNPLSCIKDPSGTINSSKPRKKETAPRKRKLDDDDSGPFTICGFSGTFSAVPKKPSNKNAHVEDKLHDADLVRKVAVEESAKAKKGGTNNPRTLSDMWKVTEEQLAKKRAQRITKQLCEMGYTKESVAEILAKNPECTTVEEAVNLLPNASSSSIIPPTLTSNSTKMPTSSSSPKNSAKIMSKKKSPPASPSKMSPLKPQLVPQKNFEKEMELAAKELRTLADVPLQLSDGGGDDDGADSGDDADCDDENGGEKKTRRKVVVDPAISSKLMDFQRDGVKFLYDLYKNDKGGILADDMGLGKTVQTIAFISAILGDSIKKGTIMKFFPWKQKDTSDDDKDTNLSDDGNDYANSDDSDFEIEFPKPTDPKSAPEAPKSPKGRKGPVLLVVPAGVIEQWSREFNKWLGLSIDIFHGQDRLALLQRARTGAIPIMISSYDTFRINIEELGSIDWDCIIFDEAHKVKNRESLGAKCHTFIRTNKRYGLTGTLMQNNFDELWTLINFMCPNYLGSLEDFRGTFVNPIKTGQRHGASLDEVAKGRTAAKRLAKLLQAVVLRRDKSIISKMLPGKDDNVVFCKLTPLQVRCYQRILASPVYKALYAMCQKCPFGRSSLIGPLPSWKQEAFPAIIRLQKVANHLLLLSPDSSDDTAKQLRDKQYQDIAYGEDYDEIRRLCSIGDQTSLCGKLSVLKSILEKMRRAHRKVLLFSHGTRTLDLLESFLRSEKFSWERMDGTVPVMYRQKLVDKFSLNPSKLVFLLSIKASSLGFNLPSASAVVLFEPDWNPSQDLQAQDRAYRIGQTAHTSVYRLVSAGTVEEMMYDRQIYKHQMAVVALDGQCTRRYFDGVAGMKGQEGELWGMANLFRFNPTDSVMTDKIIKRVTNAEERIAKFDTQLESDGKPPKSEKSPKKDGNNGFNGNAGNAGNGALVMDDIDEVDPDINSNSNSNNGFNDEIANNDFYNHHKKRIQMNASAAMNSNDLFEKLFDPNFIDENENESEGYDANCCDNESTSTPLKGKHGSIFDEINLDDCDGVVYSVKHNDVVEESKVERELSDRAQMHVEHQQRNAMKSVFSSMASATQMPASQRHRPSTQMPTQSLFASVPTQMPGRSRTGMIPRITVGGNNSGGGGSGNGGNSTGYKRCMRSLDVITLGAPKKVAKCDNENRK